MANSDTSRMQGHDVAAALGLLTRLPVPVDGARAAARGAASAWAYPLAGVVVGLIAGGVAVVGGWLGLPGGLVAGLVLLATVMVTGAMHEDGLADCADGFWGGWDPARRLEIMKDSRIGAYGVIALVIGIGLRWVALTVLLNAGVVWVAVLVPAVASRAAMVWVMTALPLARRTGLSHAVGRPSPQAARVAVGVAALVGFGLTGWSLVLLAAVASLMVWGSMALARAKIGGQTGDVLGASQQVVEIAVLMALVAAG